jgi:AcrR family transcriptional regulator
MARKRNVETEAKIAEAATKLFCTQGYVDTTMAAIARESGVSVQTLYLRHGSKAAVLSAALDVAIAGDVDPVALPEREDDFFARAREAPDAARSIAIVVHGARRICDRTHRLYDVIRSAAADPEVRQVLDKNRSERRSGLLMLADAVATKKRYDPIVPVQRTADLFYSLGTEDAYLLFVVECGWSVDDWEQWVVDTITAQVLRRRAARSE